MTKYYNASIRNLTYRLRKIKDSLPDYLEDAIWDSEQAIVSAIFNDQLYKRGINGKGVKIMSYAPYCAKTVYNKRRKGQPTTRVTLRDTGAFAEEGFVKFVDGPSGGFAITSADRKTEKLVNKYGPEIFRLTDKNFSRILSTHIRKRLAYYIKHGLEE